MKTTHLPADATTRILRRKPLLLLSLFFVCLTAMAACSLGEDMAEGSGDVVTVGQRLPVFDVTLADGSVFSSADLAGRPVVIVFFNTTCGDCRKELPTVQELYGDLGEAVRFVCIGRAEPAADVAAYWAANGLTLPYSAQSDRRVYELFATRAIPRVYVADAAGIVRATFVEKVSEKKLRAAIENALQSSSENKFNNVHE